VINLINQTISNRRLPRRFLHTTWLGSEVVHYVWNKLVDSSVRYSFPFASSILRDIYSLLQLNALSIPEGSPLRLAHSIFWHIRTNDEGPPRENGFHPLVNAGKINIVAPARVTGYGSDGHTVHVNNGQSLEADLVILATGYKSSWNSLFDGTLYQLRISERSLTVTQIRQRLALAYIAISRPRHNPSITGPTPR
jgi:dimethylaniline monooxygenase (N-oxide forming)